jgi:triphosphoribosyl-dephospho-CoA synthase
VNDPHLRADLLEARDARAERVRRALAAGRGPVLALSANLPGPDKFRPGTARLLEHALEALRAAIGLEGVSRASDRAGLFLLAVTRADPATAKRAALALETAAPAGRLLDLDVYAPDGRQADRASLGLPPRACLVCGEPAVDCMRTGRHGAQELQDRAEALLEPWRPAPRVPAPEALAGRLALGARRELDLTPKPGLVDRLDRGSHPDLSHAAMRASVDLLPLYYDDLLRCAREGRPLADSVQAGARAEARMFQAVGSNAHKGYIFLSGLTLMAAGGPDLAEGIARTAAAFFAHFGATGTHGAQARDRHGLGGIRQEALQGLPAVFRHGLPRYREALDMGWAPERAGHDLMAMLMQRLEDTTAVSRCGLEGLERLKRDGAALQRLLERGEDPGPALAELNRDYVRTRLTMGGVADCMALVFALAGDSPTGPS